MTELREPYAMTASEAIRHIETGALSALEWIVSCRDRIRRREPEVHAWTSLSENVVKEVEARAKHGLGPSIPVGVKDIIDVCGLPTTMGTAFHDRAPVTREGGSVSLMREAGCVVMGKTVTTELGHRHPGPTRNPHNLAHTPGGSSSGSAAAVADFMVPLCLGTQTSGSVIRPAAYCGVIGYKPTYGDFDKSGMLANAPSMDTLGILARSVDDIELVRRILLETTDGGVRAPDLSRLTFGLLTAPPWETADDETRTRIEALMETIAQCGGKLADVALERVVPRLLELHRLISGYEFRRSIAFERVHHFEQLSTVLREGRLRDGRELNAREYHIALQEVTTLRAQLANVFREVDILVTPSAQGPAPATLESTGAATFNSAWTLAGNPTITLPLFSAEASGLPIGCQFIAGFADDDVLLGAAKTIMHTIGSG